MVHMVPISVWSVPLETTSTLGNQYLLFTHAQSYLQCQQNPEWCVRENGEVEEGAKAEQSCLK